MKTVIVTSTRHFFQFQASTTVHIFPNNIAMHGAYVIPSAMWITKLSSSYMANKVFLFEGFHIFLQRFSFKLVNH